MFDTSQTRQIERRGNARKNATDGRTGTSRVQLLLEKLSGTIPAEHRTAYSKLNTYNNEVQAVLNPDNDFERNEDGILIVSDRAMTDVFEAYIHDEITFGSR